MKSGTLREALLFAGWGVVAYFLLALVRPGSWLIIGIPFLFGIILTGPILGIIVWLIYRLGITPYVDLVKERRRQPTLRP